MTSGWHLAQVNIGRLVAPADDPQVAGFFQELDRINALAEASAGFVWRLKGEGNSATDLQPTPDPRLIVNMSVWADAEALFDYVYRSAHTPVMAQRRSWFDRFDGAYQALWWVPVGAVPTIDEAFARLWLLDRFGPSERAFTFKLRYPAPDAVGVPVDMQPDPWCVGRA
ncbi:DUF3291 domain-containing protein [Sphingomonas sp. QA11]|uniref:DUF3291 domain-containing protein n=1 Tax=Sphingomonas sp. QA11 TaxID=2950605 RepID=UPI00234B2F8B|nr:DUF3291 domain-containing protein [Sphingomonas sp. QA11]WCM26089.1 DUF3291 domain-containing protein [Sphingomonas sp. QA11]